MSKAGYISRIATLERKLVFARMRISFMKEQIETLNKIIENKLNLSGQQVSKDDYNPGDSIE